MLLFVFFFSFFFFFNDTATTEIYTLSYTTLFRSHDPDVALEVERRHRRHVHVRSNARLPELVGAKHLVGRRGAARGGCERSEEHTSELQSRLHLVCRLLLEKKKK